MAKEICCENDVALSKIGHSNQKVEDNQNTIWKNRTFAKELLSLKLKIVSSSNTKVKFF